MHAPHQLTTPMTILLLPQPLTTHRKKIMTYHTPLQKTNLSYTLIAPTTQQHMKTMTYHLPMKKAIHSYIIHTDPTTPAPSLHHKKIKNQHLTQTKTNLSYTLIAPTTQTIRPQLKPPAVKEITHRRKHNNHIATNISAPKQASGPPCLLKQATKKSTQFNTAHHSPQNQPNHPERNKTT